MRLDIPEISGQIRIHRPGMERTSQIDIEEIYPRRYILEET
jgi:hypothetical protein